MITCRSPLNIIRLACYDCGPSLNFGTGYVTMKFLGYSFIIFIPPALTTFLSPIAPLSHCLSNILSACCRRWPYNWPAAGRYSSFRPSPRCIGPLHRSLTQDRSGGYVVTTGAELLSIHGIVGRHSSCKNWRYGWWRGNVGWEDNGTSNITLWIINIIILFHKYARV